MPARLGLRLESLEDRTNLSPPTVTNVVIGDGTIQRSMIKSLTITFSEPVTIGPTTVDAFLLRRDSAPPNPPNPVSGLMNCTANQNGPIVTLTFLNTGINPILADNGSLPDGRYTLTILSSNVTGADGNLDGDGDGTAGDDFVFVSAAAPSPPNNIFRFFGDVSGDGAVSSTDMKGTSSTPPIGQPANVVGLLSAFNGSHFAFDYDGDGWIGTRDWVQFRFRYNGSVP